jgi:hypothetical protein
MGSLVDREALCVAKPPWEISLQGVYLISTTLVRRLSSASSYDPIYDMLNAMKDHAISFFSLDLRLIQVRYTNVLTWPPLTGAPIHFLWIVAQGLLPEAARTRISGTQICVPLRHFFIRSTASETLVISDHQTPLARRKSIELVLKGLPSDAFNRDSERAKPPPFSLQKSTSRIRS